MKKCFIALSGVMAIVFLATAQTQTPDPRAAAIKARHDRGEKISLEDEDYYQSTVEHNNQVRSAATQKDWAAAHPTRESTGMIPLSELGKDKYKGEEGGLYPGGRNTAPAHEMAGMKLAQSIRHLDAQGQPSQDGKIVLITIGMSNTYQESRRWRIRAASDSEVDSRLAIVNGAMGAQTAHLIAKPDARYWTIPPARLKEMGLTPAQVQVAWLKEANPQPTAAFPAEVKKMQEDLLAIVHILHDLFPNLKMLYLSNRIYAGYAVSPLNPEPHAYESGFAVKWLIADQIAGKPELNYDPAKGPVRAPWLAWGPDLWADCMKARKDGLLYTKEDLAPDGTHPGSGAKEKVVDQLMAFFKTSPTTNTWFRQAINITPGPDQRPGLGIPPGNPGTPDRR